MNDTQLISMLMDGADLEKVGELEVEPILAYRESVSKEEVKQISTNNNPQTTLETPPQSQSDPSPDTLSQSIKLSDYEYGVPSNPVATLEECQIPNYRLAKCCANCTFSVYDPVKHSARCVKWDCCIVPVYYCDSHKDPISLIAETDSENSNYESYSENIVSEQAVDNSPPGATITNDNLTTPNTPTDNLSSISETVEQQLDLPSKGYTDQDLYLSVVSQAPNFELPVFKDAYIKKKYLQLYKQKHGLDDPSII